MHDLKDLIIKAVHVSNYVDYLYPLDEKKGIIIFIIKIT